MRNRLQQPVALAGVGQQGGFLNPADQRFGEALDGPLDFGPLTKRKLLEMGAVTPALLRPDSNQPLP